MRKLFYFLSLCLFITNCNDGDILTVELDFDDTYEYCGELVFYKTKSDPSESLTIELNTTLEELIELDDDNQLILASDTFEINGTTNTFNYRTYSETLPSDYFCEDVTPNINITGNSESESGTITVTMELSEDDGDGIPAEIEDENLDEDNDPSTNPNDYDGDGIPDYLDDDDDGDNVPTSTENPNYSTTEGLINAQDTDEDGIPDYLDDDDDGDGVLTRDEENESTDENPTNDITQNNVGPDYLNDQISNVVAATAYREHTIEQTFTISTTVTNFDLPPLSQTEYQFGTLSPAPSSERTITPDFN